MLVKLIQRCSIVHRQKTANLFQHAAYIKAASTKGLSTRSGQSHEKKKTWFGMEWFYIPAGVGFGLICFIQFRHILRREQKTLEGTNSRFALTQWQIDVLKNLPTRSLSRFWGYCCDIKLPMWLRKPLINTYVKLFECNLEEAIISDVTKFETFNKFFTRKLKVGRRIVNSTATMVSPADCTVLAVGSTSTTKVELEQIKGMTYPLDVFTGPRHPFLKQINQISEEIPSSSCASTNVEDDFKLFYCSLYLGPGDYHWFHSPTEWTVEHRRHIPGHLFSVNPRILRTVEGIFNFNERVLLSGHWENGIFLYGAIGAYNVGSVKLDFKTEIDLQTNKSFINEKFKDRVYGSGILLKRGDTVGRFELGSSIVLVFTAPKDFQFTVQPGQKLKYGEKLGDVSEIDNINGIS